jgi:predicted butyrate kinase (DUF1464 family)
VRESGNFGRQCWVCRGEPSLVESWDVQVVVLEKGGYLTGSALSAEVAYEITYCSVTQTELLSDVGHGLVLDEEGSEDFIAALEVLCGLEKELLTEQVVHDLSSEVSPTYL